MEHELTQIPWKELIIPQIVNFTAFVALLIYFLRTPLKLHFSGKSEEFEVQKKKAAEARETAERQNFEVRNQLRLLEEEASKNIDTAHRESADLKAKLLNDARAAAAKMASEAERMTQFEYQRALVALRQELIVNASKQAEDNLKKNVSPAAQTALNNEFLNGLRGAKV